MPKFCWFPPFQHIKAAGKCTSHHHSSYKEIKLFPLHYLICLQVLFPVSIESEARCYNASDAELNSTAWFVNYIGSFVTFVTLDDLTSFVSTSQVCPDSSFIIYLNFILNLGQNIEIYSVRLLQHNVVLFKFIFYYIITGKIKGCFFCLFVCLFFKGWSVLSERSQPGAL